MKKIIALMLVMVMCFSLGIGGTLAYLTDRETETNVFTVGDVEIELTEDFKQGVKLLPGTTIEKTSTLKNVGDNNAWVFYAYGVPTGLAEKFSVTYNNTAWEVKDAYSFTNEEKTYTYTVIALNDVLAVNGESAIDFKFTLDSNIDIDPDGQWYTVVTGSATELNWNNANGNPTIYVNAYAIQEEQFADVDDAIKAYIGQWGTLAVNNGEIVVAATAEEAQAALDKAAKGTTIQLAPGVDYGTLYLRPVDGSAATKTVDWVGNNYRYESYSCFENLTIRGAEGATVDAIEIEGGTYYNTEHSQDDLYPVMLSLVELKNVVIDGVTFTGEGGYDPQGYGNAINLTGHIKVDGLTIKNCVLENEGNNARLVYKTESTTTVHKYVYDGETFEFIPNLKDITIDGCTLNGGYMGLELRETENVTITNNTFEVGDRNILLPVNTGCTYSGTITITGNTSINAKERFVRADGTGDAVVVIKNNTLINYQGADADYIKVTNGSNVTVEDNIKPVNVSDTTTLKTAMSEGGYISITDRVVIDDIGFAGGAKEMTITGGTIARDSGNGNPLQINTTEKVTFEDVTFESVKGNAVLSTRKEGANIELNNCVFNNLSAPSTGNTGIQVYAQNTTWVFNNCTFNNMPIVTNSSYPEGIKLVFNNCTFTWTGANCPGMIQIANNVVADIDFNNCKVVYDALESTSVKNFVSTKTSAGAGTTIDFNNFEMVGKGPEGKAWSIVGIGGVTSGNNVVVTANGTKSYTFNGTAVDFDTYLFK